MVGHHQPGHLSRQKALKSYKKKTKKVDKLFESRRCKKNCDYGPGNPTGWVNINTVGVQFDRNTNAVDMVKMFKNVVKNC